MLRVLVTGGAGYVGAHVCKALAQQGIDHVVYDNLSRGHQSAVRWGGLETGDIRDRSRLDAVFARYRPNCVIHLAALAYVGESMIAPEEYYDNNVVGTLRLLETMRAWEVRDIVFSSSCAVYGEPQGMPISESAPTNPINPYGVTKLVGERMLGDFGRAHGLKWMALRYFNAAGADLDGDIGESHDPESHVIPLLIETALGRRPEFELFGADYPTADGTAVRDYVHVADLAAAHVAALRRLEAGGDSRSINLGTGRGASILELVQMAEEVIGNPIPVRISARRSGDPPVLVATAAAAHEKLGWRPVFSDLRHIIQSAHAWHLKRTLIDA